MLLKSAYVVLDQVIVDKFASVFNYTQVGRGSDYMMGST